MPHNVAAPFDRELIPNNHILLSVMSLSLSSMQCSSFRQELEFEKDKNRKQNNKATREKVLKG